MPLLRAESLGYVVNHVARQFARALERRIRTLGLYPGQFPALLALWERDGLTQSELCAIVEVEQPTMANTLKRMERDGLIVREPDPGDRRRALIRLTPLARGLEEEVTGHARAINAAATRSLTDAERADLLRLLRIVAAGLEVD